MKTQLSMQRLQELVAAYGGDLERFPAPEREAARALVASSEAARALVEAERELDGLLAARVEPLGAELLALLERVPERPREKPWAKRARLVTAGVAWAAAACFGLWLGAALPDGAELREGDESAAESAVESEEDELVALAAGDVSYLAVVELEP